ncbi:MAG: DNA polymerase III subunit epsilon [Burkholderiaceae bacterium]
MRQVVLDTETTGLEARAGHRVIEVGCIEIAGRRVGERRLHQYINPEREIDEGAEAVHGLSFEFLSDKPKFAEIVDELLAFVDGAEVIIHNASFDVEFLDAELKRLKRGKFTDYCAKVTDSLAMARNLHPGKRNSLDALCDRYEISNAHRTLHGALLDAGLLAEVYLAMTRGQDSLVIDLVDDEQETEHATPIDVSQLIFVAASSEEIAAHEKVLDAVAKASKGEPVWRIAGQ